MASLPFDLYLWEIQINASSILPTISIFGIHRCDMSTSGSSAMRVIGVDPVADK